MADEKIKIDIEAVYDDDDAKQALTDAKAIDKADPTLEVTADTAAAVADLGAVADATGRLSHDDTVLTIKAQIDQAKGQLETLQTSLRDVDDAAETTGHKIGDEIDSGTTKAASATHSMAGNVVGDTAAMTAGFGPLGEAVGQLTEGLLGGEVGMKDLLTAGLAMGAITLVVGQITKGLEATKAIDAFNKQKIEDFTAALKGAKNEVDVFNRVLLKDDKLEFIDAATGKTKDLVGTLADSGITWDTFIGQIAKGKDSFDAWVVANGEAIGAGDGLNAIIQAGNQYITDRAAAQKAYDDVLFVSGATAAETARETANLNRAYVDGSAALDDLTPKTHAATVQIDKFKEQTALASAAYRRLTDNLDEQQAWADVNQAIKDYNDNTKHSDEDTRNLIRSIGDYVATTDTIPESKKTAILVELNQGDVAAAEADLTELSRQRDITLLLKAVGSQDTIKLLKTITRGGGGIVDEAVVTPGAASINVALPRGARHSDISRALGVSARRNGRRYEAVHYARR